MSTDRLKSVEQFAENLAKTGMRSDLHDFLRRHEATLPAGPRAVRYMANFYIKYDFVEEAFRVLEAGMKMGKHTNLELMHALLVPMIPESEAAIDRAWERVFAALQTIRRGGGRLYAPLQELLRPFHFRFSYHGRDVRPLHEEIGRTLAQVCPELRHGRDDLADRKPGPFRVGVFFPFGTNSAMYRAFHTTFHRLPERGIEIIGLTSIGSAPNLQGVARWARVPTHLAKAKQVISALDLDMLIYSEIGMRLPPYLLAFSRLARGQTVLGGHPVTTGCPEIDDFAAPGDLEPVGSDRYYSETLVRIPGMPTPFAKEMPNITGVDPVRDTFELPSDARLYYMPNVPHKFSPQTDILIRRILETDPKAHVLLYHGNIAIKQGSLEKLRHRWAPQFGENAARVMAHEQLSIERVCRLCAEADVVVDTPAFGMGTTAFYAFWSGAPVVAYDGPFLRHRNAVAMNARLGRAHLNARSVESMADVAVRAARTGDPEARLCSWRPEQVEPIYTPDKWADAFADYVENRLHEVTPCENGTGV